jgi:predicted MFS family arabinose efflux permease
LTPVASLERRLIIGVVALTIALLVLATGIISQAALSGFEREVLPEIGREATAIGQNLAAQIGRAVALGVPPDKLVGVENFFQQTLDSRPALDSIALQLADGTLHQAVRAGQRHKLTDIAIPIQGESGPIGTLHLGLNASLFGRSAADSRWDIAIVLMVSVLTTIEILVFLIDLYVSAPLRLVERMQDRLARRDWTTREIPLGLTAIGRYLALLGAVGRRMNERRQQILWLADEVAAEAPAARQAARAIVANLAAGVGFARDKIAIAIPPASIATARAPLFLYVFAEQLSTSFIPIFAKSLHGGGLLPATIAVGVPITAFAGMIGIVSPYGAGLVGRLGARTVLVLGCIPAAIGYAMAAQAETIEAFTLWRAMTGCGYAFITIACQSYLVACDARRSRTAAVFVYAAMTGALCGTAIGSVLADRLGYRGTFVISALLTLLAAALTWRTMDSDTGKHATTPKSVLAGHMREILRNPRFMALVLFAAVPAKLVLTGFIFYISPLALQALRSSPPEIGRQIMLYSATMLLTIRAGAWLADRIGAVSGLITLAGLASSAGLLLSLVLPPALALPLGIAAIGLSQGLASAPMLVVVPELCSVEATRHLGVATLFGYLRFGERIGSIVGPLLTAALVELFGFTYAAAALGVISLAATLAYAALTRRGRPA